MGGDGAIGDSIGITITQCSITTGITRVAGRFITAAISTGAAGVTTPDAAELTPDVGETTAGGAGLITVRVLGRRGLSTGIDRQLGDTLHREARAGSIRVPSAATTMAGRRGAFRLAGARAWVVGLTEVEAEVRTGAVAGAGNRRRSVFPVVERL
jgi:hypothetical protein